MVVYDLAGECTTEYLWSSGHAIGYAAGIMAAMAAVGATLLGPAGYRHSSHALSGISEMMLDAEHAKSAVEFFIIPGLTPFPVEESKDYCLI